MAQVLLRSWTVQPSTWHSRSNFAFALPQSDAGVDPLLVKTNSEPEKRGTASSIALAGVDNGMRCGTPVLVLSPSSVMLSPFISDQSAVKFHLVSLPSGSASAHMGRMDRQAHSLHSIPTAIHHRSEHDRAFVPDPGFGRLAIGLISMMPLPTAQLNKRER